MLLAFQVLRVAQARQAPTRSSSRTCRTAGGGCARQANFGSASAGWPAVRRMAADQRMLIGGRRAHVQQVTDRRRIFGRRCSEDMPIAHQAIARSREATSDRLLHRRLDFKNPGSARGTDRCRRRAAASNRITF